jgi:hypothetical protein
MSLNAQRTRVCTHFLSSSGCTLGSLCPAAHVTAQVSEAESADERCLLQGAALSTYALPLSASVSVLWFWRENTCKPSAEPLKWRELHRTLAQQLEQAFQESCGKGSVTLSSSMIVCFDDMTARTATDLGNRRPLQRLVVREVPEWVLADDKGVSERVDLLASHKLECEYARGESYLVCMRINGKMTRVNFISMTATREGLLPGARLAVLRHRVTVQRGSDSSDPYHHPQLRRQVVLFDAAAPKGAPLVPLAPIRTAMDAAAAGEQPLFLSQPPSKTSPMNMGRSDLAWCSKSVCPSPHDVHHLHRFRHRCSSACADLATYDAVRYDLHVSLFEHSPEGAQGQGVTQSVPRVRHAVLRVFRSFWDSSPPVAACADTCLGVVFGESKEYVEHLCLMLYPQLKQSAAAASAQEAQSSMNAEKDTYRDQREEVEKEQAMPLASAVSPRVPGHMQRVQNASHVQKYVRIRNAVCTSNRVAAAEQALFIVLHRKELYEIFSCLRRVPMGFSESLEHCMSLLNGSSLPPDFVVMVAVGVAGAAAFVATPDDARRCCAPPIETDGSDVVLGEATPHCVREAETGRLWLYEPLQWCAMYIISDL